MRPCFATTPLPSPEMLTSAFPRSFVPGWQRFEPNRRLGIGAMGGSYHPCEPNPRRRHTSKAKTSSGTLVTEEGTKSFPLSGSADWADELPVPPETIRVDHAI
jgi:hypothetical protein